MILFNNKEYIICGDLNLVLDPINIDYYLHVNNTQARSKLLLHLGENSLRAKGILGSKINPLKWQDLI